MSRKLLIYILVGIVVVLAIVLFVISPNENTSEEITTEIQDQEEVAEDQENGLDQVNFLGGTMGQFTIFSYGGEKDVKTFFEGFEEYALVRNPDFVGGLELALVDPFGNYYFAENETGDRISFVDGNPEGRHGYDEYGLVSDKLLRTRNSGTEYFSAYPDQVSAQVSGLVAVPDTGAANRVLKDRLLVITNINNNITVATEIDHRGSEQGVIMVSDATRKALRLDNGSIGNLKIELVESGTVNPGIVRF